MNSQMKPIVIKKNGKKLALHYLKYEMFKEFQKLEVFSNDGQMLAVYDLEEKDVSFLSLDAELGIIKLVYRTADKTYVGEETIDLMAGLNKKDGLNAEEIKFNGLIERIKVAMANLDGSEVEKDKHTELIGQTTYNQGAKNYVMSRIRRLLITWNELKKSEVEDYAYRIFARLYGMDVLQELDDDVEVGEIMVNAVTFPEFHSDIYYIKNGEKIKYDKQFDNLANLNNVFRRVIQFENKQLNSVSNAIVEATRPNRDRVNIVIPDASEGYVLNIRKFTNFLPSRDEMLKNGTINQDILKLVDALVKGKANIGVGGPMGTGKTTFVNYMLTHTAPIEGKVVIASVSETDVDRVLKGHDVRIFKVDEDKSFTFEALARTALRTTADRVIIPESRGSEFKQVYEMNLKTRGNMFTGHALEDEALLDVCVDMYKSDPSSANEDSQYIKDKLCKAIDIFFVMRKVGKDIRIKSISELTTNEQGEYAGMNRLLVWESNPENPLEGKYVKTGNKISEKLKRQLNEHLPMSVLNDL